MENGKYWSETEDRPSSGGQPRDREPADPAEIGRYRVVRRLGQGGFGRVYLAHDDQLDRSVAIKVPNPSRIARAGDVEIYLNEARALAKLDHPSIVPVYDVGRTDDGFCYVVSRFVDGSDLAARLKQGRPSFRESVELTAVVALALHHAHTRGLVHRDVKPANILIGQSNEPWVADFGLALKEEDYGKGAKLAGTPDYMSPEQARGEGHRVDGRSDLFSLGVVFYELLSGRKPFRGESRAEVMDQIATVEPRPLRQIDDTIPRELERICQKALAKRAAERYSTGRDMADDLRHFLQTEVASALPSVSATAVIPPAPSTQEATPPAITPGRSESDTRAIKIVPKGLRSFDRHDADFFLELLPGARDRDGLPDGLRFWKSRIESTDADTTFRVGLIYGPSGCGKSSLVKAGLLPRLSKDVLTVYIESTPVETEARLMKGLRKVCPDLAGDSELVDAISALRRGRVLRPGQKVLLVLDQFEQWLFARRNEQNTELVAALRQCDGEHVQAIVMARDDFWMAATRFMRDLEIRLVEGENSAAVDLFDLLHARRVLTGFGRAYGVLPERSSELTADERSFVEQSVAGLAQDGKVIPVRLALFAEMVKGKPWTPSTLREVGGTQGVGVTFLEETFSAQAAPPEHRLHQKAAQAVLKALLPDTGTDIKGQMRSEQDLRDASGYASRPRDFDDLIGILDAELRLITPTDPEGSSGEVAGAISSGQRFYQLTHDYLVHSLGVWLTRKQRETRRGRAELVLAERAATWSTKPAIRHLPTLMEWIRIRGLTRAGNWSETERRMMRRAAQFHGLRLVAIAGAAALLIAVGLNAWFARSAFAKSRVQRLINAEISDLPGLLKEVADERQWIDPELKQIVLRDWSSPKAKLRARLALLPVDPTQVEFLKEPLRGAAPEDLLVIRSALQSRAQSLAPELWSIVEAETTSGDRLLSSAGAFAAFQPEDARWGELGGKVARALVTAERDSLRSWLDVFRPVREWLKEPLAAIFRDRSRRDSQDTIADIFIEYASDDPEALAKLLVDADASAFLDLLPPTLRMAEQTEPVLREVLDRETTVERDERAVDPAWPAVAEVVEQAISDADGLIDPSFAFCQVMPLAAFESVSRSLSQSGYRLFRFRPFADGKTVKAAAIWNRDGLETRFKSGADSGVIRALDETNRKDGYIPTDVAGYVALDDAGNPIDQYAGVWVKGAEAEKYKIYVGETADDRIEKVDQLNNALIIPRSLKSMLGCDGRMRYCGIWAPPPTSHEMAIDEADISSADFAAIIRGRGSLVVIDASVSRAIAPLNPMARAQRSLERAEKTLQQRAGDGDSQRARAMAYIGLNQLSRAEKALSAYTAAHQSDTDAIYWAAIVEARLGEKIKAKEVMSKLDGAYLSQHVKLGLAFVVAAELGEELDGPSSALEGELSAHSEYIGARYEAARAFALASKAVTRRDTEKGRRFRTQSINWFKKAAENQDLRFDRMEGDPAFDHLRSDPDFVSVVAAGYPDRRYAAVWSSDGRFEDRALPDLTPKEQLARASALRVDHFRPVALAVAQPSPGGRLVAVSVWHRPTVSEQNKEAIAARKARAAIGLVRLKKPDGVWRHLQHDRDPRLRSFFINYMSPLKVDPAEVIAEIERIATANRDSSRAIESSDRGVAGSRRTMSDILYDRDVSTLRALILAVGRFRREAISAAGREALIERLAILYQNDPDAGIHGAAEWTLRKLEAHEKLKEGATGPRPYDSRFARRWYTSDQGHTFAVIDGPVEFRMGSLPTDTESDANTETVRQMTIHRRFAIATKEVTVSQFDQFVQDSGEFKMDVGSLRQHSHGPNGPCLTASWYSAAAYCNWLSKKERLPDEELCYERSASGGFVIPANSLLRTGYRLPTEAEWEYACRAGAETSRYFGQSTELLANYAAFQSDVNERSFPCGSFLPNDLGLFDMLGNALEWCQDRDSTYRSASRGAFRDIAIAEVVTNDQNRTYRGGSFLGRRDEARSATRGSELPTYNGVYFGFRLARTCPQAP